VGLFERTSQPTNYAGVQRNFVEMIIPMTWREGGLAVKKTENGFTVSGGKIRLG
jgi:hypothetical protein